MPLNQTVPNMHGSLRIFFTGAMNPLEKWHLFSRAREVNTRKWAVTWYAAFRMHSKFWKMQMTDTKIMAGSPIGSTRFRITAKNKRQTLKKRLRKTDIAQPAIGAVSMAMLNILQAFGITADFTCGHSFGELSALCAAGRMDLDTLLHLAITRGRLMAAAGQNTGGMLAVIGPAGQTRTSD